MSSHIPRGPLSIKDVGLPVLTPRRPLTGQAIGRPPAIASTDSLVDLVESQGCRAWYGEAFRLHV